MTTHWYNEKRLYAGQFSGNIISNPVFVSPYRHLNFLCQWENFSQSIIIDVLFNPFFDYSDEKSWVKRYELIIDVESSGSDIFSQFENVGKWVKIAFNGEGLLTCDLIMKN